MPIAAVNANEEQKQALDAKFDEVVREVRYAQKRVEEMRKPINDAVNQERDDAGGGTVIAFEEAKQALFDLANAMHRARIACAAAAEQARS